jgi:RecA-family ATPase
VRPSDLRTSAASNAPWLIDQLWTAHAVGIIGGAPKSYKTWMALEMAVSVASGSACLASFAVPSPGPVLLYAAEDSESALRLRLESLAQHHGLHLAYLDIRVITADSLRLDRTADQERLEATLMLHRPVLLILDPLVRLHAIDENAAGEIAALLGYLRLLQRKTAAAIALVHLSRVVQYASVGLQKRDSA